MSGQGDISGEGVPTPILSDSEFMRACRTLANWRGEGGHDMADALDAALASHRALRSALTEAERERDEVRRIGEYLEDELNRRRAEVVALRTRIDTALLHQERQDTPNWDTKVHCGCGFESVSRCEWAMHAMREVVAALAAGVSTPEPTPESTGYVEDGPVYVVPETCPTCNGYGLVESTLPTAEIPCPDCSPVSPESTP